MDDNQSKEPREIIVYHVDGLPEPYPERHYDAWDWRHTVAIIVSFLFLFFFVWSLLKE
ncbi:hypothetical protein KJ836_03695 [Patescibacteria group bacterium]|nr:hypothetical protein [Patescibacteria group bacterium]